jgi:hypothetical protein
MTDLPNHFLTFGATGLRPATVPKAFRGDFLRDLSAAVIKSGDV